MALTVRIQKYLSEKGITSRRNAEAWLRAGLISVNGQVVTELGTKIDPDKDVVTVAPSALQKQYHYFLFNKPKGIVTVNPHPGEKAIGDIVKLPEGVSPVGRLDKDSTGLILLTDDGVAARRIMDPQFDHEKEYEVTFCNAVTDEALQKISEGMMLFGERTRPIQVARLTRSKVRMILTEGKNRQIRRLGEKVGFQVKEITRVRILDLTLKGITSGQLKELSRQEAGLFLKLIELNRAEDH